MDKRPASAGSGPGKSGRKYLPLTALPDMFHDNKTAPAGSGLPSERPVLCPRQHLRKNLGGRVYNWQTRDDR